MISMFYVMVPLSLLFCMTSMGPMKMAMNLMIFCVLMTFLTWMVKGMTFFPLIFLMLFAGGVLVTFMILSAVSPNEKSIKIQNKMEPAILIILTIISIAPTSMKSAEMLASVSYFQSDYSLMTTTILILLYFMGFSMMLSSNKTTMRNNI